MIQIVMVRRGLAGLLAVCLSALVMWPANAPAQTLPSIEVAVGIPAEGGSGNPSCDIAGGVSDGTFVVTVTGDLGAPTDVHLSWSGTAVPGTDYATPPNSITVPTGTGEVTVPVHLLRIDAISKTIVLTLEAGTGYQVGEPASATMTVLHRPEPSVLCLPPPQPIPTDPDFTG
jgi:hypothetical protein